MVLKLLSFSEGLALTICDCCSHCFLKEQALTQHFWRWYVRKRIGHWYSLETVNSNPRFPLERWTLCLRFEPPHYKTNKMTCASSEDSDQPGHQPSLIRVFTVHMKKHWVLSYPLSAQLPIEDAQADLSLRWAHRSFCWFCHEAAHFTVSNTHR